MKNYEYNEFEVKSDFIDEIDCLSDDGQDDLEDKSKSQKPTKKKKRHKRGFGIFMSAIFFFAICAFVINTCSIIFTGQGIFLKNPTISLGGGRQDGFITILLGVTDEGESRTDALVLVAYDTKNKKIELLNIPRDTYCDATTNSKKVNASYVLGIEKTMSTVSDLIGFLPDKYVVVNFDGLAQIIDTLGGVEVDVAFDMKYDDPTQDLHIDIKKGLQTLDGKNSVNYLRFRKNNDGTGYAMGDLGRIEATQGFIDQLFSQVMSLSTAFKLNDITNTIFDNIETDLSLSEILWLSLNALKLEELNSQTLPGVAKYINSISYYVPSGSDILEVVNEKLNPYIKDIEKLNLY